MRYIILATVLGTSASAVVAQNASILHYSEYYILEAQHAEQWAEDDAAVDALLAEFRAKNDGRPPNIISVLIDDIGFGDLGIPELNAVRGYETPNINDFSDQAMRMVRMYTEPSCTPTRVAQMTGRLPVRMGMGDTTVDIAGFGLPSAEVTLAEVLKDAGYATSHVGKWHMGDIAESWAMNQGFDYAQHAIHQQGQLTIFHDDAANEEVSIGIGDNNYEARYTMDGWLRTDASSMVVGVEGSRNENVMEVGMAPGERWTEAKYAEMNNANSACFCKSRSLSLSLSLLGRCSTSALDWLLAGITRFVSLNHDQKLFPLCTSI